MDKTNFPHRQFHTGEENMDIDLPSLAASANLRYSTDDITSYSETTDFKIDLFAKYFQLKSTFSNLYHYHIHIKACFTHKKNMGPVVKRKLARNTEFFSVSEEKRKQIVAELLEFNKCKKFKYVYDGRKNLLTSVELPVSRKCTYTIKLNAEMYSVSIQPAKKYYDTNAISISLLQSMTWHSDFEERNDLLQLNKALEKAYNSEIRFDRYYSVFNIDKIDIGKGLEIWRGYERSINLTQSGPVYVLNVSELVFHRAGPVIDYTNELLGIDVTKINRPLTSDELKEIKNALFNVDVHVTHWAVRRKLTVEDISNAPASDVVVAIDDNVMSVADYFKEKYTRLLYPYLPCLKMKTNKDYPLYVPLENCVVFIGQQKLDYHKTYPEKLNTISNFESLSKNEQNDSSKISLFMNLNWKNSACQDPPVPNCFEGSTVFYDTRNLSTQSNLSKSRKDSWIAISFVDEIQLPIAKITEFVGCLKVVSSTLGICFGKFLGIHIVDKNETVNDVFQKDEIKSAKLAVILLSSSFRNYYDEIKFITDYKLGMITKCVLDDTIHILNRRILTNICLSIDAKMGGISHDLQHAPKIFSQPTIVFGASIVKMTKNSTISTVVGSLDAYPSKYQVSCRFKDEKKSGKGTKDFITDLENMVKKILNSFYHHTEGKYPDKIIFFRSNHILSTFKLLLYYEAQAIQKACKDIVGSILPITFIVVSKQNPGLLKSISRNKAEATINSVFHYNAGNRPTHYYVLHDDNNFTAEELKQLTDHLCYVSIGNKYMDVPTPIRYALRAATRAKKYADCQRSKQSTNDLPDFVVDLINGMEWNGNSQTFQ